MTGRTPAPAILVGSGNKAGVLRWRLGAHGWLMLDPFRSRPRKHRVDPRDAMGQMKTGRSTASDLF
jgi:hypothetical protein